MLRLLLVAALYCIGCSADDVKNATAQGTYGVQNDYDQGYANPPLPPPPSYNPYVSYQYIRPPLPPLIDRDVCDLDASVLLVAQSKRNRRHDNHLNRAHRVRCSVIANYDEDSCNVCCQHAARRDKNLLNTQFVGFLAVTDDFEGRRRDEDRDDHDERDDEEENLRVKRSYDRDHYSNKVEPIRVAESIFKPKPYFKNVKCVCCAPKRPLPPPPVFPPPQPIYQQPVYPSNNQLAYQQPAQPIYQPPPTYTMPQAPPAPAPYPAQAPATAQPTYHAAPLQVPYPAQEPAPAQPAYQAVPVQNPQPY